MREAMLLVEGLALALPPAFSFASAGTVLSAPSLTAEIIFLV